MSEPKVKKAKKETRAKKEATKAQEEISKASASASPSASASASAKEEATKVETKAAVPIKAKVETKAAKPHGLTLSAEALARASDAMADEYYVYFWECVRRRWAEQRLEDPSLPENPPSWWVWKRAEGMAIRRDPYEGFL